MTEPVVSAEIDKEVLILGLGNLLLSDEGVGVHAAQLLLRMDLPSDVEVVDGGTGGFELIEHVRGKSKVVIIDCLRGDISPGSIVRLGLDDLLLRLPAPFSVHEGGVLELLSKIKTLSPMPEVVIIGIVTVVTKEPGTKVSAIVESQMPRIIAAVLEEISKPRRPVTPAGELEFDLGDVD